MSTSISRERYLKLLSYDPETGEVRNRVSRPKSPAGKIIGGISPRGYRQATIEGEPILLHRLIWFMVYGYWPVGVDHRDGNQLNNRLANLREATSSQNAANRKVVSSKARFDGVKGIRFRSNRSSWEATICKDGKARYLGVFKTHEEAAVAYAVAAKELFGEFART